jgi:c-di-AMP phosphodiesterase-like protein
MEKLGGGGHQTMAAAQPENVSIEEAHKMLIKAIDEYRADNPAKNNSDTSN